MQLKELMMGEQDQMIQMHRYENARHAVIKGYEIASKNFNYLNTPSLFKTDEKGEKVRDWVAEADIEPTQEMVMAHMLRSAKKITEEMTKDLNATLSVLEEKADATGDKAHSS